VEGKAEVREIRYIHQGPANGIGWQVIVTDTLGDVTILKESIYKEIAEEYATEYNKELANEHRKRTTKKRKGIARAIAKGIPKNKTSSR
jgi:2-hydroxy-3-keto-5-methylthiopentenyl-1-phosphate phosphatase